MTKAIEKTWYDYPQYYDMVFRDETAEEANFIEAACRKYADRSCRRLFEPACGSGRLVAEMAKRGYDVTGLDLNEKSLAYLRRRLKRRGLHAHLVRDDMTRFMLQEKADAAYSMVNSFRYLLTEEDARSHLKCIARSLQPGGLYLIAMHLLPLDADEECTERWTARHGATRVTATLRVVETDRPNRRETLQINLLVRRHGEEFMRLRHRFQFRMYTADQFRELLASVPEFELCDVFDFWYELDYPMELNDELGDAAFVLRKKDPRV
jgi:SAM-dependent methyltransferase